jgi:hypothetical protein
MPIDRALKEDDDLIVELEDVVEDGLPPVEEEIEDEERVIPEAPSTPDAEGNDWDDADTIEEQPRRGRQPAEDDGADEFDHRAQEMERQAREIRAESLWRETQAYAESYKVQRAQADLSLSFVNEKVEQAYQALHYAKEQGDTANEIQAQRTLDELKTLRGQIEGAKAQIPDPEQFLNAGRQRALALRDTPVNEGVAVGANLRARNPLATEWAKANSSWMKDNAAANDFVIRQSKQMTESGDYSPNERGFYAELSRRVQAKFPNLKVARPTANKQTAPQRKSAPVAPSRPSSGNGTQRPSGNATRFKLDAAAQAKMRMFNLDPQNAEHRKAYAETVMRRTRRESAQGAR